MTTCCTTYDDLWQVQIEADAESFGVAVTYYPADTGASYNTSTQVVTSPESTSVSVTGVFGVTTIKAPDDAISYATTFSFSSEDYSGDPVAGDRIVDADSKSFRVVKVEKERVGSTLSLYVLTLEN